MNLNQSLNKGILAQLELSIIQNFGLKNPASYWWANLSEAQEKYKAYAARYF